MMAKFASDDKANRDALDADKKSAEDNIKRLGEASPKDPLMRLIGSVLNKI